MPVENISLMPSSCLSLTNTRQDKRQKVTHHGSANQEFADAGVRSNEQKGVSKAGVPYLLSPIPLLLSSLPPYPTMIMIMIIIITIIIIIMWHMKTIVIPMVVGALGTVKKGMVENIKKVSERATVTEIQKICMLGSAQILRKLLSV